MLMAGRTKTVQSGIDLAVSKILNPQMNTSPTRHAFIPPKDVLLQSVFNVDSDEVPLGFF